MENLNWIPKKYQGRVKTLEKEDGLIGDCKYMLYFSDSYCWDEDYCSIPVRSKKEALQFIKEARQRTNEEMEAHK